MARPKHRKKSKTLTTFIVVSVPIALFTYILLAAPELNIEAAQAQAENVLRLLWPGYTFGRIPL